MAEKRYWWLKLQEDFFRQKAMKKLRKMERGTTYTIVYLKMQLASLQKNGILMFEHLEENFAEELAYEIDEAPEDIAATVEFLLQCGLLVELSEVERYLPEVAKNTGSEGASAKRMRELREREMQVSSHCDGTASLCYGEKEKSREDIEKIREEESGAPDGAAPPAPSVDGEKRSVRKGYGQYGWVKLSDDEYYRLLNDLGKAEVERCITYIDESAQSNRNKNQWCDWDLIIRRCHREGWGLRKGAKNDLKTAADYGGVDFFTR